MKLAIRKDARERERDDAIRGKPLVSGTPAEIDAWIDKNVTDEASMREALKMLARAVRAVALDRR